MRHNRMSRRELLRLSGLASAGFIVAACQPKIVEVEKIVRETVEVEVEKVVEKEVEKIVEKEVQVEVVATPPPRRAGEIVTIRYGTFWAMNRIDVMNRGIQIFQQRYEDIVIAMEMGGGQYRDKLAVQMAAGTEPDCGLSDVFQLGRYADAGLLLDLMPACEAEGINVEEEYRLKGVEIHLGKLVGMPWVTFGNCIYYNKTMFQEAGVPDPHDDLGGAWSGDQFIDICRTIKEKTGKFPLDISPQSLHHQMPGFIYGRCGRLYDFNAYEYTLNEPATVKAIEWYMHELYEPGLIMDAESRDATSLAGMLDPFSGEQVAMKHFSAGSVGLMGERIEDRFEWDFVADPTASGRRDENSSYVSSDPNFVSARTDKRDEAVKFILYCAQEEMQNILSRAKLSIPALNTAAFVDGGFLMPPPQHVEQINESWATGRMVPAFFHHNTLEANRVMIREIDYVILGEKTVQEACDTMQKDCQELIEYESKFVPISQWIRDFPASMASCAQG